MGNKCQPSSSFPRFQQFSSTSWMPQSSIRFNSDTTLSSCIPHRFKGSVPQDCLYFRHQPQAPSVPWLPCFCYKFGGSNNSLSGSVIYKNNLRSSLNTLYLQLQFYYKGYNSRTAKGKRCVRGSVWGGGSQSFHGTKPHGIGAGHPPNTLMCSPTWKLPRVLAPKSFCQGFVTEP